MSLLNTITIDIPNGLVTLVTTSSGNPLANFIYTQSTNLVTFNGRSAITISGADFILLMKQYVLFNNAIAFNFAPNVNSTTPFTSVAQTEALDTMNNTWSLNATIGNGTALINYTANLNNKTVTFANRPQNLTINYVEWLRLFSAFDHFKSSVQTYFGL